MQTKYVFVTGGVVSGLGKGITVASLGRLLKARGYRVTVQKFDPYINIDPGNLNPYEHGEVFITDDGAEADLDLGHYERFIDESLTGNSSMTMGKIYWSVLNKERQGDYHGATVQVIPHITNEIKERIRQSRSADIVITEVGGTVGDIESLPILEAIRQIAHDVKRENVVFVHITLVPHLDYIGEMKTKPTQHSVKELLSRGIQPNIIVCRSDRQIPDDMREKLALFCNVESRCIIQNINAESIYEVPLMFEEENFADTICKKLNLTPREPDLAEWKALVNKHKNPKKQVTVGLVGRYVSLWDSYLSIVESLNHAGIHQDVHINIEWISDKDVEKDESCLSKVDGIVLADCIGEECTIGKINTVLYAKRNNIPFFGIGSGIHNAFVAFTKQMGQEIIIRINTRRRGAMYCKLANGSKVHHAYGTDLIEERYRSYCEITPKQHEYLASLGFILSEKAETAELEDHPWFVCVQFHPEYKSRITKTSPLFDCFLKAMKKQILEEV
ncbi:MAG: CTP synthase [Defluviitaleaceae bacterium]|nr:CTP synthase [Defluviitaleaceae bacterium]